MFDIHIFGQRVNQLRKEKGVTQTALSQLLGITSTQMSDIEHGNSATTFTRLCLLCDYFGVSADYLLGRTDQP